MSVNVPLVVPFTKTETPAIGFPFSSIALIQKMSLIAVVDAARIVFSEIGFVETRAKKANKMNNFFIIINFR